jgi:hypothetical protein
MSHGEELPSKPHLAWRVPNAPMLALTHGTTRLASTRRDGLDGQTLAVEPELLEARLITRPVSAQSRAATRLPSS